MAKEPDLTGVPADESFSLLRWPDENLGPWGVRANWVSINGRPECVGLQIWHGADQAYYDVGNYIPHGADTLRPISATGIADLPIATIIDKLRMKARDHWRRNAQNIERLFPHWAEDDPRKSANLAFEAPTTGRPGAPRRYDRDHYVAVAKVYIAAWKEEGRSPTQAVADHFGVTRSAAAKWVAKARSPELQLLSPAAHGRGGASPGPGLTGPSPAPKKRTSARRKRS